MLWLLRRYFSFSCSYFTLFPIFFSTQFLCTLQCFLLFFFFFFFFFFGVGRAAGWPSLLALRLMATQFPPETV